MNSRHRVDCIEITDIVRTSDRCVIARVKDTGKLINLPRAITQFLPGRALVPMWFALKAIASVSASGTAKRDTRLKPKNLNKLG